MLGERGLRWAELLRWPRVAALRWSLRRVVEGVPEMGGVVAEVERCGVVVPECCDVTLPEKGGVEGVVSVMGRDKAPKP